MGMEDNVVSFEEVVRQFIPTYHSAPAIIVIAQQWPCWLSTVLALRLPLIGGYFSSQFHKFFLVPDSLKLMSSWSTIESFRDLSDEYLECTILASGSMNFLTTVERSCVGHEGALIFAVDHFFPRSGMRDAIRLFRSWGCHRMQDGYMSALASHTNYGGATNAVHFVMHRGLASAIAQPVLSVPRVLRHFVNSASKGGFVAIDAPPDLREIEREPVVIEELGRIEGLYDVSKPGLEYAIPCVFKSTGWVRRRLTAKEWLTLHDIPVDMMEPLSGDTTARNAIALCITPLIVGELFRSWWGSRGGGAVPERLHISDSGDMSARTESDTDHQEDEDFEGAGAMSAEVTDSQTWTVEDHSTAEDRARMVVIKTQHDLAKAVKADDAEVPVHLWNDRICRGEASLLEARALGVLRTWFMSIYRRRLCRDCIVYLVKQHGAEWRRHPKSKVDATAMKEILWRAANNEWFEFPFGSRLHFFRFPVRYQTLARDGVPNFFITPGPTQRRPQPPPTPEAATMLREKLTKVIQRRYLVPSASKIASLIKFFAVPKGEGDCRIVYHAGANGLNDCVWAPPFFLPTVDSLLRIVDHNSYMEDRDIGEMFLNFELHPNTRRFTGVDVGPLELELDGERHRWLVWTKNLMGFRSSPYNSVKMYHIVEEVIRGDRRDSSNAFQWEYVKLNLPGTRSYDPSLPWITKRRNDGTLASDLVDFVDDERIVGHGSERAREAGHTVSTRESYLGLQDALRKLRPVTREPGAWAGVVVHNDPHLGIVVLTSQEKWDKTKAICQHWMNVLGEGKVEVPFKQLESNRGFLVYVANAYPCMKPYLKGFHLSLEMWRGGRDLEGWKLKSIPRSELQPMEECEGEADDGPESKGFIKERGPASGYTPVVPRFPTDLEALLILTSSTSPAKRVVRRKELVTVVYGFGDASSGGFGASVGLPEGIHGRFGVWGSDEGDASSNYRELCNLVETVEEEARAGRLTHTEFWLFTDNSTSESCFNRGSSSSPLLHGLILRLRKVEMDIGLKLQMVHVAGTRMIAQGTDGLSRGMMCEGVLAGRDMLEYIDIAKSASSRHPPLAKFIRSWAGVPDLTPLSEEEWYVEGHGIVGGKQDSHGIWIPIHASNGRVYWWDSPPVLADVALEEALKARHKRTDTYHIFSIPRLFTPHWTWLFHKFADFIVKLPVGSTHWPLGMHEPLFIGVALPYVRYHPWSLRGTPLLVDMEGQLRQMLSTGEGDGRNILRKLLRVPSRISSVSEDVARGVLRMPRQGKISDVPDN